MVTIIPLRGHPHDQVQHLLAWYVNGTLSGDEKALVEAHLAACADCRADLASERALAGRIKASPLPEGGGWPALAARIAAGEADQPPQPVPFLRRRVAMGWVVAAPLAAAASVAAVILAALPAHAPAPRAYVALGAAPEARPGNLLLQLRPGASEARLRALIGASGARLVDGPTATGAYVLHVAPDRRPAATALLRAAPEVALAEPIDPAP